MRRYVWYLAITVVVIVGSFVGTLVVGNKPVLGLDLQGGISQVLQPTSKHYTKDSINQAVEIIRSRVNGLGVAEPEISRQGNNVIIDLPGVKDRDKAKRLVGQTAELQFRPVQSVVTEPEPPKPPPTTPGKTTTPTTIPKGTVATTAPQDAVANKPAVLPNRDPKFGRLQLGPASFIGKGNVSSASAQLDSQGSGAWQVVLNLTDKGETNFNALAAKAFGAPAPTNEVAIVLDGIVQSAPTIQDKQFGKQVSITGSFTQTQAKDLATVLNYGALPVTFKPLTTESVSPTLGKDQLSAGIAAGLIGLALVALYMLLYYRILGLVVILGLGLSGMAIYSIISLLGTLSPLSLPGVTGLTLTLAGVTGLIVSVGITVDSYVVYFERLKDEVRTGRTVRSSVDRGFVRSFRTIVAADVVSLIGAVVLYALAVGSVRQFALLLGISTALDLILSYFFMHPLVVLLAQNRELVRAKAVGISSGLDVAGAEA
ncbi:MAG TPA: protein translocase subunit SecD [Acidimicrobiia bacterium]